MSVTAAKRREIVEKFRVHSNDGGSPQVQVALLTARINSITDHLRTHPKDYAGQRGLMQQVGRRNRLLRYLARMNRAEYMKLIQGLGLRK